MHFANMIWALNVVEVTAHPRTFVETLTAAMQFAREIGMKTAYDVSSYWGAVRNDAQMLRNAAYIKEPFLDRGLQGMMGGEGFYKYPNPANAAPDFLAAPAASEVPNLVARAMPK